MVKRKTNTQRVDIKNLLRKIKKIELNKNNVICKQHFIAKLKERLSINITEDNKVRHMKNIINGTDMNKFLIQNYKGKKRMIFFWRGTQILVAFQDFMDTGVMHLITILTKKMFILGSVKHAKRQKYQRKQKANMNKKIIDSIWMSEILDDGNWNGDIYV